jgi:hypothetical protein
VLSIVKSDKWKIGILSTAISSIVSDLFTILAHSPLCQHTLLVCCSPA